MEVNLGFIGAGAMAEALISGVLRAGLMGPERISASDVAPARLQLMKERYHIQTLADNGSVVRQNQVVVLAIKPQVLREVLSPLVPFFGPEHLVISIAAGINLADLEGILNEGVPVVRVVPNTPCLVGEGVSALALGRWATRKHQEVAEVLLGSVGPTFTLPEGYMDAVTALSGSGPAYVYLVVEALTDAGVRVGLPRDIASVLATQTVLGAAKMVKETRRHPAELKDMVTSPGGTTIAGLHALEAGGVRATLMNAVVAARDRARELRG
ncbi:hypothetical protein SY88_03565 [Clostridiales bacterium PH28_bin88]|nr:hypothetical protein SY88_03565 [Clostridiales bacterium PH28_bin88]